MDGNLKTQFKILWNIKSFEEKTSRLRSELEQIPSEINKLTTELTSRKSEFESVSKKVENTEKQLRQGELELKEREERLRKSSDKLMEVKTNNEFQAAQKEVEAQKLEKSEFEDRVLMLFTAVETERGTLSEAKKKFMSIESVAHEDIKRLEDIKIRLTAQLAENEKEKSSVLSTLEPSSASLYDKVAARIKGVAIAEVSSGMCLGCNIKLRPQLYNEILGFLALHRCSSCGRILVTSMDETELSTRAL